MLQVLQIPPENAIGDGAGRLLIIGDTNLDVGKAMKSPLLWRVPNVKKVDTVAIPPVFTVSMSKIPIAVPVYLARLRIKQDYKFATNVKVAGTGKKMLFLEIYWHR